MNSNKIKLLVEDNPQIKTPTDEERDRLASYEAGANSFVRKPLDFTEFAETVARLGIYWLAVNKPPQE